MAKKMNALDWIAFILLVIGGLNWGLKAWFNFDVVQLISFGITGLANIIYSLVAISAVYSVIRIPKAKA